MNQPATTTDVGANDTLTGEPANDGDAGVDNNLNLVLDIPVTLSMEIGRVRMRIAELLELSSGSVVDLQKMVDEPLDVLVNGTLVAQGEAVVVDGKFGIRLTDVISKHERLKKFS